MIPEHYLTTERFWTRETVEASEDFFLPDYTAGVQRIVCVTAGVTLDDVFLEGDSLEAEGSILYTVLYQSGDKGLASVPLTSRFVHRIPLNRREGDGFGVEDVAIQADAENVVCRVSSPRKLTLSSRVRLQCISLGCEDSGYTVEGEKDGADSVICQEREVPVVEMKTARHTSLAEGILREREGTTVVGCTGAVCIQDVKPHPDKGEMRIAGEASVQFLLSSPDGSYISVRDRCMLEEAVTMDFRRTRGGESDVPGMLTEGTASARCASVAVTCGDNGEIEWKMEYDVDCTAAIPGHRTVAADGYSTRYPDECTFRTMETISLTRCVNGRLTVSGEKSLRNGDSRCVYGFGRGMVTRAEVQKGRLILTGNVILTGILCGGGEVWAEECTIPIRYECETEEEDGECLSHCGITLFDVNGRVDGGALHMTAEAGLQGIFFRKCSEHSLESIQLMPGEGERAGGKPTVILYTPDPEDTDWTVQKRYRVAPGEAEKTNGRYLIRLGMGTAAGKEKKK